MTGAQPETEASRYQQLRGHLAALRLPAAAEALPAHLEHARDASLSHTAFLEQLLAVEAGAATARRQVSLEQSACLPAPWQITDFDFDAQPAVDRALVTELASLRFLDDATNILLIGPPGVGKTMLAVALGHACCPGLNLPGPDPDDLDLAEATRLLVTGNLPIGEAARRMGTSTEHLRLALDRIPRPSRAQGRNAPPVVWQWQQRARALLTRDYLEREYQQNGKTLRKISAETGYPRPFIASLARQHGIRVTTATSPLDIDPDWFREQ